MDAADRFRAAVDRRDVDGMAATLAPEVSLRSPTIGRSVDGRERARMIFQILVELFEDFEYTHALAGAPTTGDPAIASTRSLCSAARSGPSRSRASTCLTSIRMTRSPC
jgi:ketosteroid isomerase-like protein